MAYERGFLGFPTGRHFHHSFGGSPAPGIYMFDQFLTYQANITGPGAPNANGSPAHLA